MLHIDNFRNIVSDSASLLKRPLSEKSNTELVEALRSNFALAKGTANLGDSENDQYRESGRAAAGSAWISQEGARIFIPAVNFSNSGLAEERAQYDITVKLFFLPGSSVALRCAQAREAVDLVLKGLHMPSIDLLIVSFPGITFESANECPDDATGDANTDMHTIVETWRCLERLRSRGLVLRIGVAEFGQQRLQEFLPWVTVRPAVDQINIPDVCLVPKDLVAYAESENIKLFTHSDCTNILPRGTIRNLLGPSGAGLFAESVNTDMDPHGLEGDIQPQWVIKYTAVVQNRGVIENKGYFAMAQLVK